mmetsp:Transcript_28156/g.77398  ORF Transcript_28156/g.77398 Transcript_28156/m.77398 type:complete len:258 (-) Transcript_28156:838-1611(-)
MHIDKERKTPLNILQRDIRTLLFLCHQLRRDNQMHGVPQRCFRGDAGQQFHGARFHGVLHFLFAAADLQNLTNFLVRVGLGGNNHEAIQQVQGNPVRAFVVGAANLGHASIGGNHQHRCIVGFQSAIQKGKAFHIQNVHLVNEQHARHQRGPTFIGPFRHLGIDLIANFLRDFPRIARKERQKPLLSRIDHVHFVQRHDVFHLLALLQFALGRLHKFGRARHGVVIARAGKAPAQLGNFAARLVDAHHVAGADLFGP